MGSQREGTGLGSDPPREPWPSPWGTEEHSPPRRCGGGELERGKSAIAAQSEPLTLYMS